MELVDTDPEMVSELVDMSEEETEKALKTVGQDNLGTDALGYAEMLRRKFLSELKNVIQERDKRKTGKE